MIEVLAALLIIPLVAIGVVAGLTALYTIVAIWGILTSTEDNTHEDA